MSETAGERIFRRMVIGLCAGAGGGEALREAARLAAELGLEMEGLFIEDEALFGLAGLPFLREIQAGSAALRPLDPERLRSEIRMAASSLQRAFAEAAQSTRASWRFASVRGEIEAVMTGAAAATDIVVVLESGGAADRTTHAAASMRRAAMRSAASLLYIPAAPRRTAGSVVAVVRSQGDDETVLRNAARIAAQRGDSLVVLAARPETVDRDRLVAYARENGLSQARIEIRRLDDESTDSLSHALDHIEQRVIVMPRGALGLKDEDALTRLAARHRVPVLVVEPRGEGGTKPAGG